MKQLDKKLSESKNHEKENHDEISPNKNIFIIQGRNTKLISWMYQFLISVGLSPIEWNTAIKSSGRTEPQIKEAVISGMKNAQAIIVLLSGDDLAQLGIQKDPSIKEERSIRYQARPNVLFEMGLAMGLFSERTIVVKFGDVDIPSDISGIHYIEMDGSPEKRNDLLFRLEMAGCTVDKSGNDWLSMKYEIQTNPDFTKLTDMRKKYAPGTEARWVKPYLETFIKEYERVLKDKRIDNVPFFKRKPIGHRIILSEYKGLAIEFVAKSNSTMYGTCDLEIGDRYKIGEQKIKPIEGKNVRIRNTDDTNELVFILLYGSEDEKYFSKELAKEDARRYAEDDIIFYSDTHRDGF